MQNYAHNSRTPRNNDTSPGREPQSPVPRTASALPETLHSRTPSTGHPRDMANTGASPTTPTMTSNPSLPPPHPRSSPSSGPYNNSQASGSGASGGATGMASNDPGNVPDRRPSQESERSRLNQLMTNFFMKMALVVVKSRMDVPPVFLRGTTTRKVNKWFNVELEETDHFREDLKAWKSSDAVEPRPPPLIIETYLDAEDLTPNQTLIIKDENGKRHNVETVLNATRTWRRSGASIKKEVILERWQVDLGLPTGESFPELAVVYKKSIVLFRSLYAYARLLPTWKFQKRLAKVKLNSTSLRICCRVINGDRYTPLRPDPLEIPLAQREQNVTSTFEFGKVESPAGTFSVSVKYRKNCDFGLDDSETLLSSHFINIDNKYFTPTLHQRSASQGGADVPGSLPAGVVNSTQRGDPSQAYGSLTSFHQTAGYSQSPLTALRNVHLGPGSSSNGSPIEPPHQLRSGQGSKSSLRSMEGTSYQAPTQRPSSVHMMSPFKSPSLSASPSTEYQMASPRTSRIPQLSGPSTPAPARPQRHSIGAVSPPMLKATLADPQPSQQPGPQTSQESMRPQSVSRYSSSFGQRRPRVSSGASKTEDDNTSSGKGSVTSSAGAAAALDTAGYLSDDDKSLTEFVKMLDQRKPLKSFEPSQASSMRTSAQLSKYQRMKDSNAALHDSMSSSLFLAQKPSSSTSPISGRQLTSIPPALSGVSVSTSSSPGKAISPHTPAIPSRLGLNEPIALDHESQSDAPAEPASLSPPPPSRRLTATSSAAAATPTRAETRERGDSTATSTTATVSPVNIPASPRFVSPRRSNSVSQRPLDEDAGEYPALLPYGPEPRQSTSLDNTERPPFLLSEEQINPVRPSPLSQEPIVAPRSPESSREAHRVEVGSDTSSRTSSADRVPTSAFFNRVPFRRQVIESSTRSSGSPSNITQLFRQDNNEDLLFDFSDREMTHQQRRSLEQERASAALSGKRGQQQEGRPSRPPR